ncbi:TonB-dependent receptor [Sphingosinicellaceae bacterium]|nr:TonB-dependent receptor [Sphingosinicellaceae bacterium]
MNERVSKCVRATLLAGTTAVLWATAGYAQDAPASSQSSGAATPLGPTAPAPALRDTPSDAQPDIIVTARNRRERLIDVPVAATVLTAQALSRASAVQIAEIAKQVPQLEINIAGAGTGANVSIRGVGSSSIDAGVDQPVSLVIDGVGTSRGRLIFLGLFDVQSVEALKGPQALFFGKNSPAGVLSLTTTSPGTEFGGYAKASYNFDDHSRYLEGAVSIPLSETFAVRVAGRVLDSRGYLLNTAVSQPDPLTRAPDGSAVVTRPASRYQGQASGEIGRLTANWHPTEQFDATLKFTGAHQHGSGAAGQSTIVACAPGATRPSLVLGPLVLTDPTGTCKPDFKVSIADLPLPNMIPLSKTGRAFDDSTTYITSLNMNYRLDDITLTSITGYINFNYANAGNFDYQSYGVLWGALTDSLKSYSQELRASSSFHGPFNFTGGLLYEHTDRVFSQDIKVPGFTAIDGRYDNAFSVDPTKGNTYSAYLQLRYNILSNLELAGGARYTHEVKTGSLQDIYLRPGNVNNLPVGKIIHARVSNDNVSPEVTLSWHPVPNSTLYGAYKTGFLSGGISNPGQINKTATPDLLTFRPVKVKGGEIGAKGSFLGSKLTVSSAAYIYDYTDLQVISFEPTTFSYTTKNAASARVKGIEVQANYRMDSNFSLRGAISYNHGRYTKFPNGQCYAGQTVALGCSGGVQDLSGTPIGVSPDWAGNLGLTYDRALFGEVHGMFSIDGYYRGKYDFTAANTYRPTAIQDGQVRVDASVRLYQPNKGFELALLARNLTNRLTILSGSDTPAGAPGQLSGTLARGREVLVEASYRF